MALPMHQAFAAHAAFGHGVDLNRVFPSPAAYMGQAGLGLTERFLFMTPGRFREDLNKFRPTNGNRR
jgi:hypothetical protein